MKGFRQRNDADRPRIPRNSSWWKRVQTWEFDDFKFYCLAFLLLVAVLLIVALLRTLFQAPVSSPFHCPVRATPKEDLKSIRDAYDQWASKAFQSCGVSALAMEAKESSLEIMPISGGEQAPPAKWPWQVLVYSTLQPVMCGGTLISSMWVVTAAHCTRFNRINAVWAGTNKRSEWNRGQKRKVFRIFSHEHYDEALFSKDIALLKLAEPLYLSDTIWPACLPNQSEAFGQGEECYTTGFGSTATSHGSNVLKELEVRIMGRSECVGYYLWLAIFFLDESMFCSKWGSTGKTQNDGICAGDSGGPLVCKKNHRWTLVGITSAGTRCGNKTLPDLFTNVSHFRDWIEHIRLTN